MTYISESIRLQVTQRARNCCEYCLVSQQDVLQSHEVDHIIAEKHLGPTALDNLCFSCGWCNRSKGSDISSMDWNTRQLIPLFNPRTDIWEDHFVLQGSVIEPLTPVGEVTIRILDLNRREQVNRRRGLISVGRYPCPERD